MNDLYKKAIAIATDKNERNKKLTEAIEIVTEQRAFLALYNQNQAWAMQSGLLYQPRLDGLTLAVDIVTQLFQQS